MWDSTGMVNQEVLPKAKEMVISQFKKTLGLTKHDAICMAQKSLMETAKELKKSLK